MPCLGCSGRRKTAQPHTGAQCSLSCLDGCTEWCVGEAQVPCIASRRTTVPWSQGEGCGACCRHLCVCTLEALLELIVSSVLYGGGKKNERRNAFISGFPKLPCDHFLLPAPHTPPRHASIHMQIAGQSEVLEGRNEKLSSCSHAESPQLFPDSLSPNPSLPEEQKSSRRKASEQLLSVGA